MSGFSAQRFPVSQKPKTPIEEGEEEEEEEFGESAQQQVMKSRSMYGDDQGESWNQQQQHPAFRQQRRPPQAEIPRRAPKQQQNPRSQPQRHPIRKRVPAAPPPSPISTPSSATNLSLLKAQHKTMKHILGALQKLIVQSNDNNVKLTTVLQEGFDHLSGSMLHEPRDSEVLPEVEEPWSEEDEELTAEDLAFVASEEEEDH
jgi:hypothetical protein